MASELKKITDLSDEEKTQLFKEFEDQRVNYGLCFMDFENIMYEHKLDYQGKLRVSLPLGENLVLWSLLNEDAIRLINEYVVSHGLRYKPTDTDMYAERGRILDLPVISSKDEAEIMKNAKDLKKPHWLPVELVSIDENKQIRSYVLFGKRDASPLKDKHKKRTVLIKRSSFFACLIYVSYLPIYRVVKSSIEENGHQASSNKYSLDKDDAENNKNKLFYLLQNT